MYDLIYEAGRSITTLTDNSKTEEYAAVLTAIQEKIAQNYATELYNTIYEQGQEDKLRQLITMMITEEKLTDTGVASVSQLADMIYNDMAGFGPITPYLKDGDAEEINVNGWDQIYIIYPDKKIKLDRVFNSSEECAETVRKMARSGGIILDGSNPIGDSFISQGVRMSGIVPPCIDDKRGASASIRKQKPKIVTREKIIEWGTATEQELDFLSLCINCGVSIAFAGDTGSGKTSDMNMLLSGVKSSKRFFIIEDNRETEIDGDDRDAVYMLTKESSPAISMNDGLRHSLRFDPNIIVPSEMRGAEALTAVEAGRTGHTIATTLHANNALSAYERILTMCLMSGTQLSEERLLMNIVEALPIVVYKTKLPDGSRKYMEIFEATGVQNGKVEGNMLFRFRATRHERDEKGEIIKTHGEHQHIGAISEALADILCSRGADREHVAPYLRVKPAGRKKAATAERQVPAN
jgi:pilus assembly protein CpaF